MEEVVSVFYQIVLPLLITLLIPTIVLLAKYLCDKVSEHLNLKSKQTLDNFVMSLVGQGVSYAEQIAKKLADQKRLSGNEKLQLAIDYVRNELEKSKIVDVASVDIANKIEAMLGMEIDVEILQEGETEGETEGDDNEEDDVNF